MFNEMQVISFCIAILVTSPYCTYTHIPLKLPHVSPWRNACCCLTVVLVPLTRERDWVRWWYCSLNIRRLVMNTLSPWHTHTHTLPPAFRMLYVCVLLRSDMKQKSPSGRKMPPCGCWSPRAQLSHRRGNSTLFMYIFSPNTPSIHAEITYRSHYVSRK